MAQLEARKEMLGTCDLALRVPASVPGMSKGASAKKTPWPAFAREAGVL